MANLYQQFLKDQIISKLNEIEKNRFLEPPFEKLKHNDESFLQHLQANETYSLVVSRLIELNKIEMVEELCRFMSNFIFFDKNQVEVKPTNDENNILLKYYPNNEILKRLNLNFKPYKFQYELARHSIDGLNNIICLRTGAGKTLISAIICKYWYLKCKDLNMLDKFKVAFIVPTRYLAEQQYNAFNVAFEAEDWSDIGKVIDEKANVERIVQWFNQYSILFLTAKKLVNAIEQDKLKIFDFFLIIFDECHHTNDLHPYSELMNLYYEEKFVNDKLENVRKPIIIGMTATLGFGKDETDVTIRHLVKFCANHNCRYLSNLKDESLIQELNENIPTPCSDLIISVDEPLEDKSLCRHIYDKVEAIEKYVEIETGKGIQKLGQPEYEQALVLKKQQAELQSNRNMIIAMTYLIELNLTFIRVQDFSLDDCILKLKESLKNVESNTKYEKIEIFIQEHLNDLSNRMEHSKALNYKNKKLVELAKLIVNNHQSGSRGLILVKTRFHTKALMDYVNKDECLKSIIIADRLTGQGSSDDLSMTEAQQREVLQKFHVGSVNLLVATDIAQEGLDVPQCNYVIRYEFVSNEIGTVQTRGRARSNGSKCYLITIAGSLNEKRELENRLKEKQMNESLHLWNTEMSNEKFNKLYDEFLAEFVQMHGNRKTKITTVARKTTNIDIKVLCRNCSTVLCNASDIAYREPCYYCVCKKFRQTKINTNLQTLKYTCSNPSCCKELGVYVIFKGATVREGYILQIKSIQFKFPNGKVDAYSQWSKIPFEVDKTM